MSSIRLQYRKSSRTSPRFSRLLVGKTDSSLQYCSLDYRERPRDEILYWRQYHLHRESDCKPVCAPCISADEDFETGEVENVKNRGNAVEPTSVGAKRHHVNPTAGSELGTVSVSREQGILFCVQQGI